MGDDLAGIRSWLSGWDGEDARLRIGASPIGGGAGLSMGGDLSFVDGIARAMDAGEGSHGIDGGELRIDAGERVFMPAPMAARLMALAGCGDPESHGAAMGDWMLEPDMAMAWVEAARRRIGGPSRPHPGTGAPAVR